MARSAVDSTGPSARFGHQPYDRERGRLFWETLAVFEN